MRVGHHPRGVRMEVGRCEDKSVGVSLTLSSLAFPWSVLDLPTGEEFVDPAPDHSTCPVSYM